MTTPDRPVFDNRSFQQLRQIAENQGIKRDPDTKQSVSKMTKDELKETLKRNAKFD